MKKTIILFVVTCFFVGCQNQSKTENKPTNSSNKAENTSTKPSANSNSAANSVSTGQNSNGEKVEKNIEVSFEPSGFPSDWKWIDPEFRDNPTKYETKSGILSINLPSGKDLFGETRTAPRLLKSISGDFEIETKVKFDPNDRYQGAGLLVFRNDTNYIRLERGFGGVGGGENGIRFDKREDEVYEPIATQEKFPTDAKTVELKMRRVGKEFTAFWRVPAGEWKEVGKYSSSYPETVQVGLIACNTAQEIPLEFAYIKLAPPAK